MYVCIYVCKLEKWWTLCQTPKKMTEYRTWWKRYEMPRYGEMTWHRVVSQVLIQATSARPSHAAGEETCLRGLPVQVPFFSRGNLENASSDNWSWNAAEMDLKWWNGTIFKGSWCQPNVLIMWGIGNCLSHHGPACHRVVISPRDPASLALELLPGRTSKPTAPEHPPKLWAPAASLSSMTSMSSIQNLATFWRMSETCFLSIGICQGTAFQQILWASWVEASEAQVLPVPPVPGCSQSQFTEFTEFTVRVPLLRSEIVLPRSSHSIRSFRSPRSLLTPLTPLTPFWASDYSDCDSRSD